MPDAPLNGEHVGTASGASGSVGEFCVAVPLIVPAFAIVVPAITSPLTTASFFSVTDDTAERTLPNTFPPSVIAPLPNTRASSPRLGPPYAPADES